MTPFWFGFLCYCAASLISFLLYVIREGISHQKEINKHTAKLLANKDPLMQALPPPEYKFPEDSTLIGVFFLSIFWPLHLAYFFVVGLFKFGTWIEGSKIKKSEIEKLRAEIKEKNLLIEEFKTKEAERSLR